MGVFMLVVYLAAITQHWVEPIAFTIGLSSLVVGSDHDTRLRSPALSDRSES